LAKVKI